MRQWSVSGDGNENDQDDESSSSSDEYDQEGAYALGYEEEIPEAHIEGTSEDNEDDEDKSGDSDDEYIHQNPPLHAVQSLHGSFLRQSNRLSNSPPIEHDDPETGYFHHITPGNVNIMQGIQDAFESSMSFPSD